MNVNLAKNAGFCFGVNRAVTAVYDSIKKYSMPIYTYGPIIHNSQVVEDLEKKGVKVIENVTQLSNLEEGVVILRSHGVPPEVYEIIKENDLLSIDMTCPYVKKIHKIVKENSEKGYQIIIVGKSTHPEVIGINGWCNNSAVVVNSLEECYDLDNFDKICIVAQTTFSRDKWEIIKNFLILNKCKEHIEFNTICTSTHERQIEALNIAQDVEVMIIIGGKHSSNTQKLYKICQENCKKCYHIETINDLNLQELNEFKSIGISAGASTPQWIIDEVIQSLQNISSQKVISENIVVTEDKIDNKEIKDNEAQLEDFDFSKELEKTFVQINIGDTIKGEIISINEDDVIVDLGYKTDGIIPITEFENDVKIGEQITAVVVKYNNEGNLILSKKQVDIKNMWEKARTAYQTKSIILIKVIEQIKGGVRGNYGGLKVFIPMSQLSDKYIEDINEFINTSVPARIIEFDEDKNNIVASSRVVLEESKEASKKDFWDGIHIGKEFIGKVTNLTNYGAFIDIGGAEGLLHISEISHIKGDNPENHVRIDEEIEVFVKEFDKEQEKIYLALKNRPESPWVKLSEKYSVGDIIEGTVKNFASYGAFVEIQAGIDGLVHISQISDKKLNKPEEMLEIGQKVKVKIMSLDIPNKRIGLSIKEVAPINDKGESNLEIDETQTSYREDFNLTMGDLFKDIK